jgi:tyrosinase
MPSLLLLLLTVRICVCFQITGAPRGVNLTTGGRPLRLDIDELFQSGPAFDLYIQALTQLQQTNQADPLSYFGIAGKSKQHY